MDKKYQKDFVLACRQELISLLNEWNPIGGNNIPEDEYECFIGPILNLLFDDKGKKDLIIFLTKHLNEHIGLNPKYSKPAQFTDKVIRWWNDFNIRWDRGDFQKIESE
ncbi:MAG: hypothetical protein V1871_06435 [Planctomycetota bacterium]